MRFVMLFLNKRYNPPLTETVLPRTIYVFDKLPAHAYFTPLAPFADCIRSRLYAMLSRAVQRELAAASVPVIGIHVRRGDFKAGIHLTSMEHFIDIVQTIREVCGQHLPATVFTDAAEDEVAPLLALPHVQLHTGTRDITDILLLSRSRFLLLSRDSSFSYWAAFLSEDMVIMHSGDWQKSVKAPTGGYREVRYCGAKSKTDLVSVLKERRSN